MVQKVQTGLCMGCELGSGDTVLDDIHISSFHVQFLSQADI